jgi:hypothetical protein
MWSECGGEGNENMEKYENETKWTCGNEEGYVGMENN